MLRILYFLLIFTASAQLGALEDAPLRGITGVVLDAGGDNALPVDTKNILAKMTLICRKAGMKMYADVRDVPKSEAVTTPFLRYYLQSFVPTNTGLIAFASHIKCDALVTTVWGSTGWVEAYCDAKYGTVGDGSSQKQEVAAVDAELLTEGFAAKWSMQNQK